MNCLQRAITFGILPVLAALLLAACAPQEIKPPPPTGEVIARRSMSAHVVDISYSVGRLEGRLAVVGTIKNTYPSALDNFILELKVKNTRGEVEAAAATGAMHIGEHDSRTFSLLIPVLRGPHVFDFRYEYEYNDYDARGRRPHSMEEDWSYFEDRIELP